MNADASDASLPAPFFHVDSGAVRFWVRGDQGGFIGASVPKAALHFRFNAAMDGSDAVAVYEANRTRIHDAVARRIAAGSLEPVMLRENDLALAPEPR